MTYNFQTKVWIRTLIWSHSSHLLNPDLPGSFWIRNKLEYSRKREDDCPVSAELPEGPLLILKRKEKTTGSFKSTFYKNVHDLLFADQGLDPDLDLDP